MGMIEPLPAPLDRAPQEPRSRSTIKRRTELLIGRAYDFKDALQVAHELIRPEVEGKTVNFWPLFVRAIT